MSWRDQLVRRDDAEELGEAPVLDERWERIFGLVDQLLPSSGGFDPMAMAAKGALMLLRRRAAEDPEGTRASVVQYVRLITAALEVEPSEVYEVDR